jgi:hypothetical protein
MMDMGQWGNDGYGAMGKLWIWANGETILIRKPELLEEKMTQCHFVHHKSLKWTDLRPNPRLCGVRQSIDRLKE